MVTLLTRVSLRLNVPICEQEAKRRQTHTVAGEAAVASARKELGNGDIVYAKAAREKAALEYDQANEDRASELAVGIYVES